MTKKINILVLILWMSQCIAFIIVNVHRLDITTNTDHNAVFLIYITIWHIILLYFLLSHKKDFVNTITLLPETKINTANVITLVRISSVPFIVYLLSNNKIPFLRIVLAFILVIIFLTDLLDGFIARKYKQETKIGRMLDSMGDYALLVSISIVYYRLGILTFWFFYLIIVRLMFQALSMAFFIAVKCPAEIKSTKGGKITIASSMILYTFKMAELFISIPFEVQKIYIIAEYICAAIIFIFFFEKIYLFHTHYLDYKNRQNKKTA